MTIASVVSEKRHVIDLAIRQVGRRLAVVADYCRRDDSEEVMRRARDHISSLDLDQHPEIWDAAVVQFASVDRRIKERQRDISARWTSAG